MLDRVDSAADSVADGFTPDCMRGDWNAFSMGGFANRLDFFGGQGWIVSPSLVSGPGRDADLDEINFLAQQLLGTFARLDGSMNWAGFPPSWLGEQPGPIGAGKSSTGGYTMPGPGVRPPVMASRSSIVIGDPRSRTVVKPACNRSFA